MKCKIKAQSFISRSFISRLFGTLLATTLGLSVHEALASAPLSPSSKQYSSRLIQEDSQPAQLLIRTLKRQSSSCEMTITEISYIRPLRGHGKTTSDGAIQIAAEALPGTRCKRVIGPHFASLSLQIGPRLPLLSSGTYTVTFNNEDLGTLVVNDQELTWNPVHGIQD